MEPLPDFLRRALCTPEQWAEAQEHWGANCGPGALCGLLGIPPWRALSLMPEFVTRGHCRETMMRAALDRAALPYQEDRGRWPELGMVRILWHGPWWDDPTPFAREYHSHWVAVRASKGRAQAIFDANAMRAGGWLDASEWASCLVPWLLAICEPQATGGWEVAESFSIAPGDLIAAHQRLTGP